MTIQEGVKKLIESEEFKLASRHNVTLRTRLNRIKNGTLKTGALIELLLEFGYTIEVKKPRILKYK